MKASRTWVKICGVTRVEDAEAAAEAGADAVGVNFVADSRRFCEPRAARLIVDAVGARVAVYGVFARAGRARIEAIVEETGVTGVQLHGDEADDEVAGWRLPVLRAVLAGSRRVVADALAGADGYRVLVDSAAGGGSGTRIDDGLLDGLDLSAAVVAGGLTPNGVADVVERFAPWGVDVAGGVESAPGIKDHALIKEFVSRARTT